MLPGKPSRYRTVPARRQLPKGKRVTIAAGFVHRDGVLLCADTELTAGALKLRGAKVAEIKAATGHLAVVFAGHVHNAVATIQKMERKLQTYRGDDPMGQLERLIGAEHERLVLTRHLHEQPEYDFSFIIAFKPPHGKVQMHATDGPAMWREKHYKAIGIGATFATQMIQSGLFGGASGPRDQYLVLASHVMGSVKKHVAQCGGLSLFIDLGHNGAATHFYGDSYLEAIEKWFSVYYMLTWNLAVQMGDTRMSDADFVANLKNFTTEMIERREKWRELRDRHIMHGEAYQSLHRSTKKPIPPATTRGRKGRTP